MCCKAKQANRSREDSYRKADIGIAESFRSVFEVPTCFCLWHCLALGLQAWLAQSGAPVQLRLGIQRAPGRRIPWEEKVCTSTQGIQLAVGLLAYHVNSQDCFAWVLFWFGLFYAKVVYCKIHEQSWESSPHAAESSDHGMVVQRAGHCHLCLQLGENKP